MTNSLASKTVAVVGATGMVGEVLLRVLEHRRFPIKELRPLASARSAGEQVRFRGRSHEVREVRPEAFEGADFVFFAATGGLSKELAPEVVRRGAIAIDKSGTWRMDPKVPLVVPEINADALRDHEGIIACPNCTTIGLVMALEPLRRAAGLRKVIVTTLQAVSGAGRAGMEELERQAQGAAFGGSVSDGSNKHSGATAARVFAAPIHNNVVPQCDRLNDDGFTTEECKLRDESRKILALPDLDVTMTCVRVPVPVGHAASVFVVPTRPMAPEGAMQALENFDGVQVTDLTAPERIPTPRDVADQDKVLIGRVRREQSGDGLWLWQVSNNLRKGAATNAVQIAESLIEQELR